MIYSAHTIRNSVILTVLLVLVAVYLLTNVIYLAITFVKGFSTSDEPGDFIVVVMATVAYIAMYMLVPAVVEILLFKYSVRGYACDYEANHVEFCVTRKGRTVMNILYQNAESVEYKPMKFLWFNQGFHVKIKMKRYSLDFDYVVPRAMQHDRENFAFEIITREIVRRRVEEEISENATDGISKKPITEELTQKEAERLEQQRLKRRQDRELLGKGVVYSAHTRRNTVLMTIPLALIAVYLLSSAAYMAVAFILSTIRAPHGILVNVLALLAYFAMYMLVPAIVGIVLFRYIVRGYACEYEANQVGFLITRKGKTVMNVLYQNAESVGYKPMKYLWFDQGFHVTIKMKSDSLRFDYVVPRAMQFHQENFPFYIIEQEIVRRKIGNETGEQDAE